MKVARIRKYVALASALACLPSAARAVADIPPGQINNSFTVTSAFVARVVPVPGDALFNPADPAWAAAPTAAVVLQYKITNTTNTQSVWNVNQGQRVINVQSINDAAGNIFFKSVFQDATKDDSIADVPRFHDALAISIPFGPADDPRFAGCAGGRANPEMIHMGNPCTPNTALGPVQCCPVGMLFWRADTGEHEVVTGNSPGSVHEVPETDMGIVHTFQRYDPVARTWTVIVSRPLVVTAVSPAAYAGNPSALVLPNVANLPRLARGSTFQMVMANWDGSAMERNGIKFIGNWGSLVVR